MRIVLLAFTSAVIFWFFVFAVARAWDYEQAANKQTRGFQSDPSRNPPAVDPRS